MGKTTNILDLNNRLSKVEKENIAQNSYTSLKNKPKINNVTLTGNKSLADIGAAAASDVGDITLLNTTDKSSCVGAINELKSGLTNFTSTINTTFIGAVPNGKWGDNILMTIPFWNPNNKLPVISEAYIYDSDGSFTDILNSLSIVIYNKVYLNISIPYNANYVGKLIRVDIL